MKKPRELCMGGTEHGEQQALFQWANVAMWLGFAAAWSEPTYELPAPLKDAMAANARAVPELKWFHAIHNQGHGDAIRGGQAKAEGVKAGIPDTFLPLPRYSPSSNYHGLYIEMKLPKYRTRKDGGLNEAQIECIPDLKRAGYAVAVCYGWYHAAQTLQTYIETGRLI